MHSYVIQVFYILSILTDVQAKTSVSIQFIDFYNTAHRGLNGDCCDNFGSFCFTTCENWFAICITSFPVDSKKSCLYKAKTWVIGKDELTFPGNGKVIGPGGLTNLIQFTYDESFIGFGFRTKVWDDDGNNWLGIGNEDDLIDNYVEDIHVKPNKFSETPTAHSKRLKAYRTTMAVIIRAKCVKDWYNDRCSAYCVATYDAMGHYTCDVNTGDKICNRGWTGPNCANAICHQNCDLTHANCTLPDDCDCFDYWEDKSGSPKSCSQCILKKGCVNGDCINGNDCHCNTDWLGELCNQGPDVVKNNTNECQVKYRSLGCFHDDQVNPRPLPELILTERDSSHRSWNKRLINWTQWNSYHVAFICRCAAKAKELKHRFFSAQFFGECWSGPEAGDTYFRNGEKDYKHCIGNLNGNKPGFKQCQPGQLNCVGKKETNYVFKLD